VGDQPVSLGEFLAKRFKEEVKFVSFHRRLTVHAIVAVLAVLYAMLYRGGSGLMEGARFGMLVGLYAVGSFVLHNHVNLNIGAKLTVQQAVAYFVEWTVVGIVIGLIYRGAVR